MNRRTTQFAVTSSIVLLSACFSFGCSAAAEDSENDDANGAAGSEPANTFNAPLPSDNNANDGNGSSSSNGDGVPTGGAGGSASANPAGSPPVTPPVTPPTTPPVTNPSPPPASTCTVSKDANGFFWRTSSKSDYVAYVPASYSASQPMRVIVGMHGCSDDAMNFAKWGINPWDTRATQQHIGISISGETGGNKCWNKGGDDDKVLAAVDDIAKCFWVDRSKVIIAGFSSGGELAYRVGLMNASKFAGILIENSSLYAAGSPQSALLGGASWKINVAHRAHSSDSVFPISQVKADWSTIQSAGFPITTSEVAGTHDGDGADWANWLIPQASAWTNP